jgi:hypothetical protein
MRKAQCVLSSLVFVLCSYLSARQSAPVGQQPLSLGILTLQVDGTQTENAEIHLPFAPDREAVSAFRITVNSVPIFDL